MGFAHHSQSSVINSNQNPKFSHLRSAFFTGVNQIAEILTVAIHSKINHPASTRISFHCETNSDLGTFNGRGGVCHIFTRYPYLYNTTPAVSAV